MRFHAGRNGRQRSTEKKVIVTKKKNNYSQIVDFHWTILLK